MSLKSRLFHLNLCITIKQSSSFRIYHRFMSSNVRIGLIYFFSPFLPKFNNLERFSGRQLHHSTHRKKSQQTEKNVLQKNLKLLLILIKIKLLQLRWNLNLYFEMKRSNKHFVNLKKNKLENKWQFIYISTVQIKSTRPSSSIQINFRKIAGRKFVFCPKKSFQQKKTKYGQ